MQSPIQTYLEELHASLRPLDSGALASYIPELTKADPAWFGISVATLDGVVYNVGDVEQKFTIQSISKPFVYATALVDRGLANMSQKVGVEPSGDAFNSISLDPQTGAPLNPMINAGAIAVTSLLGGDNSAQQWQRMDAAMTAFAGHQLEVDESVYHSESQTGFRNRAIAWMLKNFDVIAGDPMATLENYFRQCSYLVDCKDLALMAATLANGGVHPVTGRRTLPAEHVERVLSVMTTCGMYDYSGSWLYEVGIPAKSGVGGGILAVLPGRFGIGIFSPKLDAKGNSVRGIEVCKRLSKDFGLHIFSRTNNPSRALGRVYTGADAPSRRQPSPQMRAFLGEHAHRIKYFCLQGFLAVDGVEFVIRKMIAVADQTHSFILDMHQVDGISECAARLLNEIRVEMRHHDIAVVLSRIHGRQALSKPLRRVATKGDRGYLSFEDNDLAVEWCENRLAGEAPAPPTSATLENFPLLKGIPANLLQQLQAATTQQDFAVGEEIVTVGQPSHGRVYFIESGQVSVLVPLQDGAHHRITVLSAGMSFGEMVLLGQTTRTATVHADTAVSCRILDSTALERIATQAPLVKIVLLENLAKEMAHSLRRATQWIAALA